MVIDGDISIGNRTITINEHGSLEIYVGGDIKITGNGGFNNTNLPDRLVIYGTHDQITEGTNNVPSISVSGNGAFSGILYAPNANFVSNGGGNGGYSFGAIIANQITFNGSPGDFSYYEPIADMDFSFGGYSLAQYKLKANGDNTPCANAQSVIGDTDYDTIFEQLFD